MDPERGAVDTTIVSRRARWVMLCLVALLGFGVTATALASGPVKGARYLGATVQSKSIVTLKVARNGRTVSVSVSAAPVYCGKPSVVQFEKTKPAKISTHGAFKASISYEGLFTPGVSARVYVEGRFNGKVATGKARSEFLTVSGCNGKTSFSAKKQ
jgi:hypothetical protein